MKAMENALLEPTSIGRGSSLCDARSAYFDGDFERCLDICGQIQVKSLSTASEIGLLSARAHLRARRPDAAEATIADTLETHTTLDAALTAQMLLAEARIRQDDVDAGLGILYEAARRAEGVHFSVRSEIALSTALGHWANRDIDRAERYLSLVDQRSDIIHARSLELRAWCHTVRHDFQRAAEYFQRTLNRLNGCKTPDRAIAANSLCTIAIYAAELVDRQLAEFVDRRARDMEWPTGLAVNEYLCAIHQAFFREMMGDTVNAYILASHAYEIAPTAAYRVIALAQRSGIARNAGEHGSAKLYIDRALRLLMTIDRSGLKGDERHALSIVAENCAEPYPEKAGELFAEYSRLRPEEKILATASGDTRRVANDLFIAGRIARCRSDKERAAADYRESFAMFKDIGYVRRAAMIAHEILKVTEDRYSREYLFEHIGGMENFISRSSAVRSADPVATLENPMVAALPRSARAILLLVFAGKTNREIAAIRNVKEQTVKNLLTSIARRFGVSTRAELISARFGIASSGVAIAGALSADSGDPRGGAGHLSGGGSSGLGHRCRHRARRHR